MPTTFSDGTVTVTLDDRLDAWARSFLSDAERQALAVLEREAEAVKVAAEAQWYQQVTRRTGRSGDLQVVTRIDGSTGNVRVSLGSTDTRAVGSKPVPVLVHRPGPLSEVRKEITRAEYTAARKAGDRKVVHARKDGKFYRYSDNPKASDGRFLLVELVRKPLRLRVNKIKPELARVLVSAAGVR